ncbi:MAG: glycosyltransferase [Candidatus Sungbacteria bacterium]|nr:glycosyltransferase [Candidatus Sungbacteria bacterium]
MYLSWIIPALNEERRIEKTLREVDAYLRSKNFSVGYEIIVVDSSSKDRTEEIVLGLRKDIANLRLINLPRTGKGAAVRRGLLESIGDYRIFSDADNSTAPEYFDAMERMLKQGFDVVISSRNPKDVAGATRDIKEPWYREILGNLGNMVIQIFGVWGIWDTQNGFKACTKKAAEDIFSRAKMTGFSFDIEMLALARKLGYSIGIIPIRWKFDPDSKVTLGAYIKVFMDVFKIRWNLMTGVYNVKFKNQNVKC